MSELGEERRQLRRGAALMASGTATSRVLGLVRGMVLVAAVGATGQAADAFAVANKLPNVLFTLLAGGVLNAVLVPQVVRAYRQRIGQEYVDRLLTFGFATLGIVTLVLTIAAPLLVRIYADPGSGAQLDLATAFAFWCIPQMFFYGAYALLGQVLNARSSFGPYMWAPVANNIVSIAGFLVFIALFGTIKTSGLRDASAWGGKEILVLAGSATVAVACQTAVLIPAMRASGVRYRPRGGLRGSGLGRAGRVATWTFVGLAVGQLGYIVVSRAASAAPAAAGSGAIAGNAAYDAAFLVFMLPHSLVTVSLATALFTRLSGQAHDRKVDAVRATMSYGMRVVGLFTVLATAVITVLAVPVTDLVLWTAAPASVHAVAGVVVAMILGLVPYGAWSMYQRVFYAYEDARGMVPIQVAMAVVVVVGTLVSRAALPARSWVVGAGVAMSASYLVGVFYGAWHLRRWIRTVDGPRVLRLHVRAAVAGVVAALVGLALTALLGHALPAGHVRSIVECAVGGALMAAIYVGALRVMRVREVDGLLEPLLRRLPGAPRATRPSSMRPTSVQVREVSVTDVARGTLLAGRYRVLDPLTSDLAGASLWTASDQILDRGVRVRTLTAAPAAALDAARRAALVSDPRLVRVLDVGTHAGLGYVVSEHVGGVSLEQLLARGPLTPDQARAVVGEAAAALEVARRRGVHHLALRPSVVHVGDDGRVRVSGLALDAAILGTADGDARTTSRDDAVGLVRLLYAALTAHWPADVGGSLPSALPAAPSVGGVLVPPADLAPGVPNDLDTLCVVTLGPHDDGPHTPGELVHELEPWGEILPGVAPHPDGGAPERTPDPAAVAAAAPTDAPRAHATVADDAFDTAPVRVPRQSVRTAFEAPGTATNRPGTPPPATPVRSGALGGAPLPSFPPREPVAEQPLPRADSPFDFDEVVRPARTVRERRFNPTGLVLAIVIVAVVVGVIFAVKALFSSIDHRSSPAPRPVPTSTSPTSSTPPASAPATSAPPVVASVSTVDPSDPTTGEHAELAARAIDGDPNTAWYTRTYKTAAFSGLKPGVALVIALQQPAIVSQVTLTTGSEGGNVEIRAGDAQSPTGGAALASGPVSGTTTFTLGTPTQMSSVVVWVGQLPTSDGEFRLVVNEVTVS